MIVRIRGVNQKLEKPRTKIIRSLSNFSESALCDKALYTLADNRKKSRRVVYSVADDADTANDHALLKQVCHEVRRS
ncbi:MAG TPA: hypothetical protein DEB28_15855 [Hyphomonas sp.]|jgi:hypothetical protein|uniref:hypothetical protein n=1 Tax=Hyphomonas sp. TaxID=87 RepID=UPI000C4D8D4D|nr:hypothetical protein [Hyphomonas sp.]MAN89464.1 hypothetical protein [Hyphomonadaceae bacterium]MAA81794.1 hypothetical protein [Hyphomonas sp.]MAL43640.1 hypothetical protein [Hyphomonas sp.]MAX82936.1 hypothetical protein [Hyphomonas sp.]MBG67674.1 hypothetical protein [Hyphomonas sp.]|tara:strand:+ start:3518 stop:3748 length:231 start_codon:yes stop_codon:yes gene_type:complete